MKLQYSKQCVWMPHRQRHQWNKRKHKDRYTHTQLSNLGKITTAMNWNLKNKHFLLKVIHFGKNH